MRVAPAVELTTEQVNELTQLARSPHTSVGLAQRARIVLLASQGLQNKEIGEQLGIGRAQVALWRKRYLTSGLQGIELRQSRGARPTKVDVRKLLELTAQTTQDADTLSAHKMAEMLAVSPSTVMRHWRANGLKPPVMHRFGPSNDPQFVGSIEDIVGVYVSPPEHALVLSCKQMRPMLAPDRLQTVLPPVTGAAKATTNKRQLQGMATLFAALKTLNGRLTRRCMLRNPQTAWLKFLRKVDHVTPKTHSLHLIADNIDTHGHPSVQAWMVQHPRFHMHFTTTSIAWLTSVQRFYRDMAEDGLRCNSFSGVPRLVSAIVEHVVDYNAEPKPFVWTGVQARAQGDH
ncbi:IS630 family transposase [Hydrogenophaga sp. NFH-34]|uniref:IS630 family transposase n=1 Tax=Hydrogenophaga sp. NFH-34 TaxID=2744446 RepID=UPI001F37C7BF|nr:IS630 family transposase [Hydrogenophaga sp. NFH-34]